ncbi:unnamed protein product, partial [Owenia fusiformis]
IAKMSWDSYIDNLIGHTAGNCDKACIIGLDGSKWTTDGHDKALKIQASEAATIGQAMTSKDFTPFQTSGILVEGIKYQFLRGEDTLVLGKKKDNGAITFQSSKKAIVIGHTAEGQQQGNTNKGVGVIAEYLESLGM